MTFTFDTSLIFFTIYVISITALYLNKNKTQILLLNVFACTFAGIYLYINGGLAGVIACTAAALGSIFQLTVERYFSHIPRSKYLLVKAVGCTVFATIGILAVYKSFSDLYLVVAIVSCRSSEMLRRHDHLRMGYLFAELLWLLYAIDNSLILFAIVHFMMSLMGTTVLLRDHLKKPATAAEGP